MSQYIEALNRSRSDKQKNSLASVEIDLSTLTGRDWVETMDDSSAGWQQGFLSKALLNLFEQAIWEIGGQFYGADCLLGESCQAKPQHYIDIFDRYVRASPGTRHLSLDQLVRLTGEAMLDRQLVA